MPFAFAIFRRGAGRFKPTPCRVGINPFEKIFSDIYHLKKSEHYVRSH
ncbi:hypothetical protein CBM2605_A280047 [Cupriavidus neocaledonicus]|uniref:Uncharacterized protein n=1 Tax=Cupriavidus neocaledonicus TaxID=1040979 RepID=A0ABY1V240_9BURK|nr:hypothetical protein CBM2605_A280047 [Cupriavidus neocaledonicus]